MPEAMGGHFRIDVELVNDISVVRVAGELDLDTEPIVRRAFDDAALGARSAVELHLDELTFIDSSGLRCLLQCAQRVERFVLVDPTPQVARVLAVSGLDNVLEIRQGSDRGDPATAAAGEVG